MTAAVPDPREPKPCPRCGTVCTHDGWGHVHPNGLGIGSCAVPDPRFRDQLAEVLEEVRETVGLHQLIEEARRQERYCCSVGCGSGACETCPCCGAGWCVAGVDGLPEEPEDRATWLSIAAEHNPVAAELARVQGAANQRAVEELRSAADWLNGDGDGPAAPEWPEALPRTDVAAMLHGRADEFAEPRCPDCESPFHGHPCPRAAALASPAPAPRAEEGQ